MFETLQPLAPDAILGLMDAFAQDSNPNKIDLGVGVYKDEAGTTPVPLAVRAAEQQLLDQQQTKSYIGPAGDMGFNQSMEKLLLGTEHSALKAGRTATLQTPGGSGALRVAAELIVRAKPGATLWVSDPTWANHIPLLGSAGLNIKEYPYYCPTSHALRFDDMLNRLESAQPGDLVLLHGCCHNPSGADLSQTQWQAISALAQDKGFTPFIDLAYQGFGENIEADAYGVRLLADKLPEVIVAASCSKNFGLYRERTGCLTLIMDNKKQANACLSHAVNVVRGLYSMPPAHGAAIVGTLLQDDALRSQWQNELTQMHQRISTLRCALSAGLKDAGAAVDFSFIERQKGMFSFLGISPAQVQQLRNDFSIYMVESSRINIAGINKNNIDRLASAIVSVMR